MKEFSAQIAATFSVCFAGAAMGGLIGGATGLLLLSASLLTAEAIHA